MKSTKIINSFLTAFIICSISACSYNNLQPSEVNIEYGGSNFVISTASKCHVIDGSVIVYPDGFSVKGNIIHGYGVRVNFTEKNNSFSNEKKIVNRFPLDSIVAVTTYTDYTGGRDIANGTLGFLGILLSGVTVFCIGCPKCCFGSCPTIYTFNNSQANLETELFSSSISRMLEADDLDKITQKIPDDGIYKLKITNEALETHYIDKFNLILTEHPLGTEIYPNTVGGMTLFKNPVSIDKATNSKGEDITDEVRNADTVYYRSGVKMTGELREGPKFDWAEITSAVPENADNAKILVRYRNTLLSTVLFYDVVLGSQGIRAVDWIDKMNNNASYASDFKMIYDNFSGMGFEINTNGVWISAGKFPDAGPICWKYTAAEISLSGAKEIKFRLKFIPDNFMIDYIGVEYGSAEDNQINIQNLTPVKINNLTGDSAINTLRILENADKNYLITNPGDSYSFVYKITKRNDVRQSLMISSKGYYNEWIRGSWIKADSSVKRFNLYNVRENLILIAESWELNKELLESEFFKTRISVKEK